MLRITLTIYSNGFIAQSTTITQDTDLFLEQTLLRLAKEGIIVYKPEMIRKKHYTSEVICRSELELMRFPDLSKACDLISNFVYKGAQPVGAVGILLDADPLAPGRQIRFRFERREGVPTAENQFYSLGPLSSDQHQQVLDAIEEALAEKP